MSIPQAIVDDLNGFKKFSYSELFEEELRNMEEWRIQVADLLPVTVDTWSIILPVLGYDLKEYREIVKCKGDKEQLSSDLQSCFTLKQLINLIENDVRLH